MSFITNITSSPATTGVYSNGYPINVDNDGGNVRAGGTVADSDKMSSSSLGEGNPITTLVSGVGNTAANHAGTWNQTSQYQDIVGVTTTIAGTSNTTLLFGALDDGIPSINQKGIIRSLNYKSGVVAGNWNVYSGTFSPALLTTIAGGWSIKDGDEQGGTLIGDKTDRAANPTQDEPGRIAYMAGAPAPTTGNYARRTLW